MVAAGTFRGDTYIIDTANKYEIIQILNAESPDKILQIAWHPDIEYLIATASADQKVRVWDTKNVSLFEY